jgi:TRAP-type C4-dicarboxylate transport system substrate-binding protein
MKKVLFITVCLFVALTFTLPLSAIEAEAKTIELKFATAFSPKHTMQRMVFEPWAKKINALTNGQVEVTFFPGGALGKAPEHYALVEKGIADIVYIIHDYTPGRFPMTNLFELPFMGKSAEDFAKAMWQTYEKFPEFRKEYEPVKVLALWAHPPGTFFTTKKPIRTTDDFKGLKFRTSSPFVTKALKGFGAAPVSLPVTEAYTALERGVVDGTVFPYEAIWVFKMADLIKYASRADFYTMTMTVLMNKRKWASLPPDIKKVIEENSGMAMSLACGIAFDKAEAFTRKKCLEKGIEEFILPDSEIDKLKALSGPLRAGWVKDMAAKGLPGQTVLDEATMLLK